MSGTVASVVARLRFEADDGVIRPRLWRGESLRIWVDFVDQLTGAAVPPTGVEFRVRRPDGAVLVFAAANVGGTGATRWIDLGLDQAGAWTARVTCAGPTEGVDERRFDCLPSAVDPPDAAPPWVDALSGVVLTPSGQPVTATRIANLPALGAPQPGDTLPVVRAGGAGRITWTDLLAAASGALSAANPIIAIIPAGNTLIATRLDGTTVSIPLPIPAGPGRLGTDPLPLVLGGGAIPGTLPATLPMILAAPRPAIPLPAPLPLTLT